MDWKFPCIVCGSRAHLEQDSIARRSFFRTVLMYGFHFLVWLLTVRKTRDTQCGFKLFTRSAARICFPNLHIERWYVPHCVTLTRYYSGASSKCVWLQCSLWFGYRAFDVELLYIAEALDIPCEEVAVYWTEIEGNPNSLLQRSTVMVFHVRFLSAFHFRIQSNTDLELDRNGYGSISNLAAVQNRCLEIAYQRRIITTIPSDMRASDKYNLNERVSKSIILIMKRTKVARFFLNYCYALSFF